MADLAPGSSFAGHRIEAVAGRGGMGVVYRATQLALDRTVALKVIAPGCSRTRRCERGSCASRKVAASIDHPNVIPIYYAGEEHGDRVHRDALRRRRRRAQPRPPRGHARRRERAARIVAQLGSALDAAHAAGLVHRDIKPANVLLGPERARLPDRLRAHQARALASPARPSPATGSARSTTSRPSRSAASGSTRARTSTRSAACCTTRSPGDVPFQRDGDEARLWAHLSEPAAEAVSERGPGCPRAFDDVIERALAKDPDERYPVRRRPRPRRARGRGRRAPAAERERLVAKGAAAPVESPTVTAGRLARPACRSTRRRRGRDPRRARLDAPAPRAASPLVVAAGAGRPGSRSARSSLETPATTPPATPAQRTPTATATAHGGAIGAGERRRAESRSASARTSSARAPATSSSARSARSGSIARRREDRQGAHARRRSASGSPTSSATARRLGGDLAPAPGRPARRPTGRPIGEPDRRCPPRPTRWR